MECEPDIKWDYLLRLCRCGLISQSEYGRLNEALDLLDQEDSSLLDKFEKICDGLCNTKASPTAIAIASVGRYWMELCGRPANDFARGNAFDAVVRWFLDVDCDSYRTGRRIMTAAIKARALAGNNQLHAIRGAICEVARFVSQGGARLHTKHAEDRLLEDRSKWIEDRLTPLGSDDENRAQCFFDPSNQGQSLGTLSDEMRNCIRKVVAAVGPLMRVRPGIGLEPLPDLSLDEMLFLDEMEASEERQADGVVEDTSDQDGRRASDAGGEDPSKAGGRQEN